MERLSLDIVFDYACPYCYQAYLYWQDVKTAFPAVELIFHPCEAHPRPGRWSPHSDLAVKGMYYCQNHGVDLWAYHELVFRAFHIDRINPEDIDALSDYLAVLLDAADFKTVVGSDRYEARRLDANRFAWEELALDAVPSYRLDEHVLKAVENVGVSKQMLMDFMTDK